MSSSKLSRKAFEIALAMLLPNSGTQREFIASMLLSNIALGIRGRATPEMLKAVCKDINISYKTVLRGLKGLAEEKLVAIEDNYYILSKDALDANIALSSFITEVGTLADKYIKGVISQNDFLEEIMTLRRMFEEELLKYQGKYPNSSLFAFIYSLAMLTSFLSKYLAEKLKEAIKEAERGKEAYEEQIEKMLEKTKYKFFNH